jgi:hypothetical protein
MSDPLSITVSVIALIELSCEIASYFTAVRDRDGDIERIQNELQALPVLLTCFRELLDEDEPPPTLAACSPSIRFAEETFQMIRARLADSGTLRSRLLWPHREKDIKKLFSSIAELRQSLSTAVGLDQL